MRNFGLFLFFLLFTLLGHSQTPCDGASGQIVASGYYSTYDNYYQQCIGESMTFNCENVILPDGGSISSIEWRLDETTLPTQPDGSLILNPVISTIGNISAHVNSSTGCVAVFNLDLPIVFINTPQITFDETLGSCELNEVPVSVNYDSYYQPNYTFTSNQTQLFDNTISYNSSITVEIPDAGTIENCDDLSFLQINLEHSFIQDVGITLTCPNGTTASVKSYGTIFGAINFGQALDNDLAQPGTGWDYYWSENGNYPISFYQGSLGFNMPLPSDHFRPDESFCNFIGCPINGTWNLTVEDFTYFDNGYVFSWTLAFPDGSLPSNSYAHCPANTYAWTSDHFSISNETELSAEIAIIEVSHGLIQYELTNTAGCVAAAEKDFTFLQQEVIVDAGDDFAYFSGSSSSVAANVVDLSSNCFGESFQTTLCYGNDQDGLYTFCASDYFDCSDYLKMNITGTLENFFDYLVVWVGVDTSLAPIYNSEFVNESLDITSLTGCITVQILSDAGSSCETGQFPPLEISLYPSLIPSPTYQWTPSSLFETPQTPESNVLPLSENTWATFTYDVPLTSGCTISDSLLISLPDNTVLLTVFLDENNNGLFDESEVTVPYFQVNADGLGTMFTNAYGQILTTLDEATSFEVNVDTWQWNLTTPSLINVDENGWQGYALEYFIGINPTANLSTQIEVALEGLTGDCNTTSNTHASVFNEGNFYPGGQIQIQLDPLYTYVSSSPEPISTANNLLVFDVPALNYHELFDASIIIQNPDENAFGEITSHHITGYYYISSETLSDALDTDSVSHEIICAYDPNIKITQTGIGEFNDIAANTPLEYTIQFQNIGNAEAETVSITDELSDLLNVATIQPISWSHDFTLHVEGNLATFTFAQINLPGIEQDPIASQGFVRFRIQQMPDLSEGTIITNTATIIFDENSPIVTNTTTNRIPISIGVEESYHSPLGVYPNPTNDVVAWNDRSFKLTRIVNSTGASHSLKHYLGGTQYSTKDLPSGVYIFQFENHEGKQVFETVIKQ